MQLNKTKVKNALAVASFATLLTCVPRFAFHDSELVAKRANVYSRPENAKILDDETSKVFDALGADAAEYLLIASIKGNHGVNELTKVTNELMDQALPGQTQAGNDTRAENTISAEYGIRLKRISGSVPTIQQAISQLYPNRQELDGDTNFLVLNTNAEIADSYRVDMVYYGVVDVASCTVLNGIPFGAIAEIAWRTATNTHLHRQLTTLSNYTRMEVTYQGQQPGTPDSATVSRNQDYAESIIYRLVRINHYSVVESRTTNNLCHYSGNVVSVPNDVPLSAPYIDPNNLIVDSYNAKDLSDVARNAMARQVRNVRAFTVAGEAGALLLVGFALAEAEEMILAKRR